MSTLQLVFVVVAITVSAAVLVGAFVASRALGRVGKALERTSERLSATATEIPDRAAAARQRLAELDQQARRLSLQLVEANARIDKARTDLRASRDASDTLRVRLIEGRLTIARIRQLVRLLMRLGELRRDFL